MTTQVKCTDYRLLSASATDRISPHLLVLQLINWIIHLLNIACRRFLPRACHYTTRISNGISAPLLTIWHLENKIQTFWIWTKPTDVEGWLPIAVQYNLNTSVLGLTLEHLIYKLMETITIFDSRVRLREFRSILLRNKSGCAGGGRAGRWTGVVTVVVAR